MLWRKAWVETRWRFLVALALLLGTAIFEIRPYAQVEAQFKSMAKMIAGRPELLWPGLRPDQIGMRYHDFLWGFWFTDGVLLTLCAVILGYGGIVSQQGGGGALYTLSMPVTRGRLLFVRPAMGLAELAVLALVPALAISLAAPLIGQPYPLWEAPLMGATMLASSAAVFGLTVWLSTVFADRRVALLAIVPPWLIGNFVTVDIAKKGRFGCSTPCSTLPGARSPGRCGWRACSWARPSSMRRGGPSFGVTSRSPRLLPCRACARAGRPMRARRRRLRR